ncbi:cytochrome b5-like [Cydia amplana]|uniref:cytochrome b5-like n=1 Tax=Cydia amplana TaxID=1869771 RepID=UPI002FE619F9
MTTVITRAEVKQNRHRNNLWLIIHDDVFDVTKFLEEHPGGEDTLLDAAGSDATQAFEDVGHSEDARELLQQYKIGTLPDDEKSKKAVPVQPCNWKWYALAALIIGAIAVGAMVVKKNS